jgi:hypothetical protein
VQGLVPAASVSHSTSKTPRRTRTLIHTASQEAYLHVVSVDPLAAPILKKCHLDSLNNECQLRASAHHETRSSIVPLIPILPTI